MDLAIDFCDERKVSNREIHSHDSTRIDLNTIYCEFWNFLTRFVLLQVSLNVAMFYRLLILSDAHLFSSRNRELFGVNTFHSLERVAGHIKSNEESYDLAIVTGDLSEDGNSGSYEYFHEMTNGLADSMIWMNGNHDQFKNVPQRLTKEYLHTEWYMDPWGFILLDTSIEGKDEGTLSEQEMDRLELFLRKNAHRHVILCLHHQPVDVKSRFIDRLGLCNKRRFWEVTKQYTNVRAVLFGHVHQEYDAYHHGVRVMSTPSTSMQFKPLSYKLDFDHPTHGYRSIILFPDGSLGTKVSRIPADY